MDHKATLALMVTPEHKVRQALRVQPAPKVHKAIRVHKVQPVRKHFGTSLAPITAVPHTLLAILPLTVDRRGTELTLTAETLATPLPKDCSGLKLQPREPLDLPVRRVTPARKEMLVRRETLVRKALLVRKDLRATPDLKVWLAHKGTPALRV